MADASKAQKVREYVAKHPKATPQEVSKGLTAPGVAIGARYASSLSTAGALAIIVSCVARTTVTPTYKKFRHHFSLTGAISPNRRVFNRTIVW